ncbi:hypothetical protein BSLG_000092 [Batrachochytrium salamandrivorans]|nr:hypothetical protein BSLG_000092 [Batrachochytrium salamandrivorans]
MSTEPHMQQQNPMSQLSRLPIHSTATTTITTAVANEKIDPLVAPQAQATATEMDSEMEDGSGVECMDVVVDVEKESPVIEQFVNNIMKGGNRAVARRIISDAMLHIQTQTRQDPRAVIIAAVERASPFVKVASAKRRGKNIPTPVPLTDRQRYRTGILWIRDAALKGRNPLSAGERIGREVLAIMADKSIVLQKREQVHKLALANRSNIIMTSRKMR